VPEDIHLANPFYLLDRAFKLGDAPSSFALQESDYPLVIADDLADAPGGAETCSKVTRTQGDGVYRG
jgi:flagellar biosynthesis protein FlhF